MTTNPETLIHLEGIKKVFLTDEVETHALAEISLEVRRGEFMCIAGPSGCGKSTLLSILGLLDSPTEGTYDLNGQSVANLDFGAADADGNQALSPQEFEVAALEARSNSNPPG